MTDHNATDDEWQAVRDRASLVSSDSCLMEILSRVEALERLEALERREPNRLIAQDHADSKPPQTLHSIALQMVENLGRSFHVLPEILYTLRRAIREPMEPAPGAAIEPPELSDEEASELYYATSNMDSVQTSRVIHRAGWDAAMAAVAQQAKSSPGGSSSAPGGSLMEAVTTTLATCPSIDDLSDWSQEAHFAILTIADHIALTGILGSHDLAQWLRQEAEK